MHYRSFTDDGLHNSCLEALVISNMSCPQFIGSDGMLINLDSNIGPILTSDLHTAPTPHYLHVAMHKLKT